MRRSAMKAARWLRALARGLSATAAGTRPPPGWDSRYPNVALAVSREGRYLARVRLEGGPYAIHDRLYLLERGTSRVVKAAVRVGPVVNTDSLDFYDNPLRICVVNYTVEALAVPSLAALRVPEQTIVDLSACARMSPATTGDPELDAWLEKNLCTLGRYLLPREGCLEP